MTVVAAVLLSVKPQAGSNSNKYLQHFAYFLHFTCSEKHPSLKNIFLSALGRLVDVSWEADWRQDVLVMGD